ncbi:unnamed protein product [Rhizophagus irregularis]|uniref:Uncharacterized protein n=1 Tax=Rhizophagus irregularis TaxID=588596 RepID=A0A916DXQ5_9GLOM|nr:unnamed protein product [Rhizophagus irregularis]
MTAGSDFEEQNHRTQSNSDLGFLKRKKKQKRKLMERKLKQSFGFGTLDLVSDVCFLLDFMPCCRSDRMNW